MTEVSGKWQPDPPPFQTLVAVEIPANKPIHPFLGMVVKLAKDNHLEYQKATHRH